jgi:hypothetical protein
MFIMRGNTADHITAEEMGAFVERTAVQANPGMLSSMASTVMLWYSVPLVAKIKQHDTIARQYSKQSANAEKEATHFAEADCDSE